MEEKVVINGEIYKKVTLSLTGKNSHEVLISPGQGSFSIGVKKFDKNNIKVDAWVNENDIINWSVFNFLDNNPKFYHDDKTFLQLYSSLESENKKSNKKEYSDWPRWFYYTGNDIGFINWSKKRHIDNFTWKPLKDMNVDFTNAYINDLTIYGGNYKLSLIFGDEINNLDLYGNLNNFDIKKSKVSSLRLYPIYEKNINLYQLPQFNCFNEVKTLLIEVNANAAPFDCSSLLQFPNLEKLHLIGNLTNLDSLINLKKLKRLGFWNVPNLSGLPQLNSWNNLSNFVAMNIDENVGKKLRKEISNLKKIKKFEFVSVTKLRNQLWFDTEYNIPFSDWNNKNERIATRTYKICLKKVKESKSAIDIKSAIVEFTDIFNKLDNIESIERDDIYNALCLIMGNSPIEIEHEKWIKWFDETRDF